MLERQAAGTPVANGHAPDSQSGPDLVESSARRVQDGDNNYLHPLGEKIFLDRYALKDMHRENLKRGDVVVVCVNTDTGQREIGTVVERDGDEVAVQLKDGEVVRRAVEHVDRPLETHPDEMQDRVARGVAAIETEAKQAEWESNFRWLLDGWKFVPGGRILTAAGTDQQLTFYNCYVIPSPEDSRDGIVDTLSQMTEIMSRGGGVGINLSTLRPRYAYVKGVNGRSSGSVSWGSLYSFVTGLIEQGGSRRGALMLILNVWHPDVMEFISAKREAGRITNANISVGITDDFMAAVEADEDWDLVFPDTLDPAYDSEWTGDLQAWQAAGHPVIHYKTVRARELWETLIESAWASAEPGIWFSERTNKMSNSGYFSPLVCTNPCVTGDTLISTTEGLVRADELYRRGQDLEVVVDTRLSPERGTAPASHVFKTGRKPVYKLSTVEGYSLRATADHRIYTPGGWKPLGSLRPGDQICLQDRKGGFGTYGDIETGRSLGWLLGAEAQTPSDAVLSAFGYESVEVSVSGSDVVEAAAGTATLAPAKPQPMSGRRRVPEAVLNGSEPMQRGFLQALFSSGATVEAPTTNGNGHHAQLTLRSASAEMLESTQRLLLNFAVPSRRVQGASGEALSEALAGRGSRTAHTLVIDGQALAQFQREVGLLPNAESSLPALKAEAHAASPECLATVADVSPDGTEDVYDLTEPRTHSFIANGIVVHNCGEQPLPAWGVCNLGAINLSRFARDGDVDWEALRKTVHYAVRFLDNVIDATPYFFEENAAQQKRERRVGMGTMGLAELMIRCGVRYGSDEGTDFIDRLYGFIATQAYLASTEYAAEKGSFPEFDADGLLSSGFMEHMPENVRQAVREKGLRNVTLLTQAPTGTTGTMVGTSTGIEPFYSWTYFRKSRLGMHEEKVDVYAEWAEAHPDEEMPDYFVTAMDLAPREHIRTQAAIQRWVDSAISKTCNVPNDYTVEQTRELYEYMYREGCKGGTVYRDGSRDEQVLHLKDEKAKEPTKADLQVKPRPRQMVGVTYRINTPVGKTYVTVNRNPKGDPFEIFVNLGKAGSDLAADAEAIGRLISLTLRLPSVLSPRERLEKIMEELEGIGGSRTVGFGSERVRSLPDGISHALKEEMYGSEAEISGDQPSLFEAIPGADLCPSCGHASFVREEGCQKCYSCGHSEC